MRRYNILTGELALACKCNVEMIFHVVTCNSGKLHRRNPTKFQDIYSSSRSYAFRSNRNQKMAWNKKWQSRQYREFLAISREFQGNTANQHTISKEIISNVWFLPHRDLFIVSHIIVYMQEKTQNTFKVTLLMIFCLIPIIFANIIIFCSNTVKTRFESLCLHIFACHSYKHKL